LAQFTFGSDTTKRLEAAYLTPDVLRRRGLVHELLAAQPGERILDVGSGPGFFAAELLERVGPKGSVVGVDASPDMLASAAHRCEGFANVEFRQGDALSLPVEDADFDAALCVQVLEYVEDATAALAEMRRALRPGGRVVIWDSDWGAASWHSEDPERMRRVLRAWDEHLTHPSLPRTLVARLRAAGFENVRAEGHSFFTNKLSDGSFIGSMFPMITRFIEREERLPAGEAEAWADEQRELNERGEFFLNVTQFGFTGTKP
jgi:arsenite methyltransferase